MIRIDQGKQEQRQRKSGKERPDEGGSIDLWMTRYDGWATDRPGGMQVENPPRLDGG